VPPCSAAHPRGLQFSALRKVQAIEQKPTAQARRRLHEVVFESDTPAGRAFDLVLLWAVILSVLVVMIESVASIRRDHGDLLRAIEWMFTGLFTVEYVLRLLAVRRPLRYATSFFGVVDLMAILPTFVSLLVPGAQALLVVRIARLLRVFRILKLGSFLHEADVLRRALAASRAKITVFLGAVIAVVVVTGTLMYLIEYENPGFSSIPLAIYWAIVTLTTVGFGDITPKTPLGQILSSVIMIMGYGIIAVPTGIVSVELANASRQAPVSGQACPSCSAEGHQSDAVYCRRCGHAM
jgi:voltage-gated potassium channel